MDKLKKIILAFFVCLFVFAPGYFFADDDLDGNDDGNTDYGYGWQGDDGDDDGSSSSYGSDDGDDDGDDSGYSGPDISDMNNWTEDDWNAFYDYHQEEEDGWDGTSATAGQQANDWHSDDRDPNAEDFDYENYTTVMDADGNIVTIGLEDVMQDDGTISFTYTGPGCDDPEFKAEVEARIAEFFADSAKMQTYEALYEAMSNLMAAKAALDAAKKAGEDAAKIAELEAKVESAKAALDAVCEQYGYSYSVSGKGNYGAILDKEGKPIMKVGDPVILATGEFIIEDMDLCSYRKNAVFDIQRRYSSDEAGKNYSKYGIFGQGWSSNLESRIIRGYSRDFIEALPNWLSYIEELKGYEETMAGYLEEDTDCSDMYASMQELLSTASEEYEKIKSYADKSEEAAESNKYVGYAVLSDFVQTVGLDVLFYVQDNGGMIVFNRNDDGSYSLHPSYSSMQVSLSDYDEGFCVSYDAYGAKRYYSKYGLPEKYTFKDGGKIEFFYDSGMRLSYITLDGKKSLSFTWNGERLASVTEVATGRKITYAYENQLLSLVTDYEGNVKKFSYASDGYMEKQIKADGSYISFEFREIDGKKRCTRTTNEEGKSEYFDYDTENRKMTYTDYDGKVSLYRYDSRGRTISEEKSDGSFTYYEYDEENRLICKSSNFDRITFSYDSNGNMTEKTHSDGRSEKWTYSNGLLSSFTDRDGFKQSYFYDSQALMTDIYCSSSLLYHFEYDSDKKLSSTTDCTGNKTTIKYDSNGNVTEKSVFAPGSAKASLTEKWTYDSENRPSSYTDGLGRKTTYSYGPHTRKTVTSEGLITEEIYSARKLLLSRTLTDSKTGESRTISYEYDKNRNCRAQYISGIDSKGKKIEKTKLYSFDYTDGGEISRLIEYDVFSLKSENWATLFSYFSDGSLSSSNSGFYSDALYDSKTVCYSQKIENERQISQIKNEDGRSQTQSFDGEGRLLSVSEKGKSKIEREYSPAGRLLRSKSGKSGFLEYSYDEFGTLSGKREAGGTLSAFDKTEFYADGRKKSYTDRNENLTTYFYDECKNLVKIEDSKGTIEKSYDLAGRLISEKIKNKAGKIIKSEAWSYGARTVTYILGGKYSKTYFFNAFGEITGITDGMGNSKTFEYDILGRKTSEKDQYGYVTNYFYNGRGQVTKIVFPNGSFLSYEYDSLSNCTSASDGDGLLWKKNYDASSRVKSYSARPFTFTEYYEYDEFDKIISSSKNYVATRKNSLSDDGKSGMMCDARGKNNFFSYDGFSRLQKWTDSLGKTSENVYKGDGSISLIRDFSGQTKKYSYSSDGLSFKIDYSDGDFVYYEYDAAGNLIHAKNSVSDFTFYYDEGSSLILQRDENEGSKITYEYDSAKNLVKMTGDERVISYTYGKKGELLSISDELLNESSLLSLRVRFVYDSMGNETLRVFDSGESVKSSYDNSGRLILQLAYDSAMNLVFVDGSVYDEGGRKIYSLNSDFTVTAYSYDEFGRLSEASYPYSDERAFKMKELVSDSGLHYLENFVTLENLSLPSADYEKLSALCSSIGFGTFQIPAMETILKEKFVYDENDNIVKRINPYNTINYSYDSENRLKSWGNGCFCEYDDNGNLTQRKSLYSDIFYEYNGINRVKSVSGIDYINDEVFSRKNTYDALGRKNYSYKSESGSVKTSYIGFSTQVFESKKTFSLHTEDSSSTASSKSRTTALSSSHTGRYVFISDETGESDGLSSSDSYEESPHKICPLYGHDGKALSYFSKGTISAENRSILMSDKTLSVRAELSTARGNSFYDYDSFGNPVSFPAQFAFVGKNFDEKTHLYDFGFRDYESQNARFLTVDPIHDGNNWYSYCSGNPIEFVDKNGLYALKTEEQYMQDMKDVYLGNSDSIWAVNEGCLVTAIAEALCAFAGNDSYVNSYINSCKECFNGEYINWTAIETEFGLHHETVFTAAGNVSSKSTVSVTSMYQSICEKNENFGYKLSVDQKDCDPDIAAIEAVLDIIAKSDEATVVIAQVCYDIGAHEKNSGAGLHFVGISTEVVNINGTKAVAVTATSMSDKASNFGGKRAASSWFLYGGKVYVPLSRVNRIDTITKPD